MAMYACRAGAGGIPGSLDVIAIADHYEYNPHKADVAVNFPRSYQVARPAAETGGIILIPAGEITRAEPQGHHNALFLDDIAAPAVPDSMEAIRVAASMGAFIFWNHPGWKRPGRKAVWTAPQDTVFTNGWLKGIEVVNGTTTTRKPTVGVWKKNLTMLGNSDIHGLIVEEYELASGGHRPMTLAFARERTADGVREALEKRCTVVWWEDTLIGENNT